MSLFDSINETNRAYCLHHVKRSMFLYKSMNYTLKNELYGFFMDLMDSYGFFHNPYRCGPLRVGRYALAYPCEVGHVHSFSSLYSPGLSM